MIKNIRNLFLFLFLLTNCSFDHKSGIWSGNQEEKARIAELERIENSEIETLKIYDQENIFAEEIVTTTNVILSEPKKNEAWKMSGLNLQNSLGNIYLPSIRFSVFSYLCVRVKLKRFI